MAKKYTARVAQIDRQADGVYSITLESEGKPFQYYPGQFLHLAIDEYDPSNVWPESRCFSIQTAPESNNIRITYAVKGRFTARMEAELAPGGIVALKLPYGDLFTQEHNKNNTVFLAGGTGITPFLSLFNSAAFKEYINPVLIAGFRNRALNFYQIELKKAKLINTTFRMHFYYENEAGLIQPGNIPSGPGQTCFISGPPAMISYFRNALQQKGIEPKDIKTDDWE